MIWPPLECISYFSKALIMLKINKMVVHKWRHTQSQETFLSDNPKFGLLQRNAIEKVCMTSHFQIMRYVPRNRDNSLCIRRAIKINL
jgi:hypothetical protein